ncbi:MAG: hypothetical protein EA364_15125 [Balneolaceae bacterium]|nr:MAG: hypothetical protein EA364_15125 [Balneolaceae bacterium]
MMLQIKKFFRICPDIPGICTQIDFAGISAFYKEYTKQYTLNYVRYDSKVAYPPAVFHLWSPYTLCGNYL